MLTNTRTYVNQRDDMLTNTRTYVNQRDDMLTNTRTYVNQRDDMLTKTRNKTTTEYTLMHNKYIITYECHDNAPRM